MVLFCFDITQSNMQLSTTTVLLMVLQLLLLVGVARSQVSITKHAYSPLHVETSSTANACTLGISHCPLQQLLIYKDRVAKALSWQSGSAERYVFADDRS